MASPLRFETIEKRLNLDAGTLQKLSVSGSDFPLAGVGVAVEADVVAWLQLHGHLTVERELGNALNGSTEFADPDISSAGPEVSSVVEEDASGVTWITVRIPVVKTAPAAPGSNPAPSFRISGREYHLRKAWGAMHAGCKGAHSQLRNGNHVDRMSNSLKFLLEQVAIACGF